MTKILGLHPEDVPLSPPTWCHPTQGAPKCPEPSEGFQTNPSINDLTPPFFPDYRPSKVYYGNSHVSANRRTPFSRGIIFTDYANRNIPARNYWRFGDSRINEDGFIPPLTEYSCRFYVTTNSNPLSFAYSDTYPHMITFMNVSGSDYSQTDRFSLMLNRYTSSGGFTRVNQPFFKGETNAINLTTPPTNNQITTGFTWRIQIQVQNVSPKVTLKIWKWADTGTPWYTVTCNPASIDANCIMLGRHPSKCGAGGYIQEWWFGDLEVFDTYNLDGTADQHYQTPVNTWYEMVDGQEVPVLEEGVVESGVVNTTDKNNWHDRSREFVYSTSNYTVHDLNYDPGKSVRALTLWVPTRTAPSNGWPVVMYVHGGFFSAGVRGDVHDGWVYWLLRKGYAVVSIDYIFAWQLSLFDIAKPAWPNQGSGRFPSFISDVKLAALWIKEQEDYALDHNRVVVTGHSAGAYLAQAAAISRDLSNLNGFDLTVNSEWGGRSNTPDPIFKGAYTWATPSDMWWAYNNDASDPDYGPLASGGNTLVAPYGKLKITANLFYGKNYDYPLTQSETEGSSLASMVSAQTSSKIPKIGLVHGQFDGVVPAKHMFLYQTALASKSIVASTFISNKAHDTPYTQMPQRHFELFLDSL